MVAEDGYITIDFGIGGMKLRKSKITSRVGMPSKIQKDGQEKQLSMGCPQG